MGSSIYVRDEHSPAMYLAVSESTLATRDVNDGRPSEPGAGWMTSAPMFSVRAGRRTELNGHTHDNCRIVRISQNGNRRGVWDGVDAS